MSRVGHLGPGHIADLLMHADVVPFPNFALDLIIFALHFAFSGLDLDFATATSIS